MSIPTGGHESVASYLRAICWTLRPGQVVRVRRDEIGRYNGPKVRDVIGRRLFRVTAKAGVYIIERLVVKR